jgi:ubiquinone/menaquinone biosynthesis C-methylase UbiE
MSDPENSQGKLFDELPDTYDRWFETPIGSIVKAYETDLLIDMLKPPPGELILDAGCGTGIFTMDILNAGATVTGLDISRPMLKKAIKKFQRHWFNGVSGDMLALPFADGVFDKVVSVTAIEFLADGALAMEELFRVAKKGSIIVVATLNSLSPWARRRTKAAQNDHSLFKEVVFRSPEDMRLMVPLDCEVKTAIHFQKDDDPEAAVNIEKEGQEKNLITGAFLVIKCVKH